MTWGADSWSNRDRNPASCFSRWIKRSGRQDSDSGRRDQLLTPPPPALSTTITQRKHTCIRSSKHHDRVRFWSRNQCEPGRRRRQIHPMTLAENATSLPCDCNRPGPDVTLRVRIASPALRHGPTPCRTPPHGRGCHWRKRTDWPGPTLTPMHPISLFRAPTGTSDHAPQDAAAGPVRPLRGITPVGNR